MFSIVKRLSVFQVRFRQHCYKVRNTDHCICSFSITVANFLSLVNLERNRVYLPPAFGESPKRMLTRVRTLPRMVLPVPTQCILLSLPSGKLNSNVRTLVGHTPVHQTYNHHFTKFQLIKNIREEYRFLMLAIMEDRKCFKQKTNRKWRINQEVIRALIGYLNGVDLAQKFLSTKTFKLLVIC